MQFSVLALYRLYLAWVWFMTATYCCPLLPEQRSISIKNTRVVALAHTLKAMDALLLSGLHIYKQGWRGIYKAVFNSI